jgi:hypothetical protein
MSQDDVERVARAICEATSGPFEMLDDVGRDALRCEARAAITAYLSAMPQRLSPELIAQLNAPASRLTEQGEYAAVDLIDTVVARVTAMPQRELLAEALDALEPFAGEYEYWVTDIPEQLMLSDGNGTLSPADIKWGSIVRARAAADKIRAALEHQQKGEGL